MSFMSAPIPSLDHMPHAAGAPPGVRLDLGAYDAGWVASRPSIVPIVGVVHTNGGGGEGSYAGAIGWANGGSSRTHAHYNLNAPTPSKNLATDKRAIANSTPRAKEIEYGVRDSSYWTIAIETADRGYLNGGGLDLGDFLYDHAELVARIMAYESLVWGIPLDIPASWVESGWVTHTSPWDGVYTIYKGKSCPGTTKKERLLRGDVMLRARLIHAVWSGAAVPPTEGEMEMKTCDTARVDSRSAEFQTTLKAGEVREVWLTLPAGAKAAGLNVVALPVSTSASGYMEVRGLTGKRGVTVNWAKGANLAQSFMITQVRDGKKITLRASRDCEFVIDVTGLWWS